MQSAEWIVQATGQDCLGNCSTFVVYRGFGLHREVAGTFVGDLYKPGTIERARQGAHALARSLNN